MVADGDLGFGSKRTQHVTEFLALDEHRKRDLRGRAVARVELERAIAQLRHLGVRYGALVPSYPGHREPCAQVGWGCVGCVGRVVQVKTGKGTGYATFF